MRVVKTVSAVVPVVLLALCAATLLPALRAGRDGFVLWGNAWCLLLGGWTVAYFALLRRR